MLAFRSKRFWLPRETAVILGSDGFPIDPESQVGAHLSARPVPFESISHFPVLGLLGEPGMGKTSVMGALAESTARGGPGVLYRDLGEYSTETALNELLQEAKTLLCSKENKIHIFLDGLDDGLRNFTTFVAAFKRLLRQLPPDRVLLRIACRPAEWPLDVELFLKEVFRDTAVYQLVPLRRVDVREAAQSVGIPGDGFLRSVDEVRVSAFAIRPITLEFLLNIYQRGSDLPRRKWDLYQQGCLALADEGNPSRRRERKLSASQRFAIAGRVAAVNIFCGFNEIWTGPRHSMPDNDLAMDTLFGGEERYGNEVVAVNLETVREALDTGLFSSRGLGRLGFAHQTYAEFLAATYLINRGVTASEITKLVSHRQGSGKVVPQLREVAAWLAALSPDVGRALIANDPETIITSDTPPTDNAEIVELIREILRRYESGDITDESIVRSTVIGFDNLDLSAALRPYFIDESKSVTVRRVAMSIYQMAKQSRLQTELAKIALNDKEPYEVRTMAICATGRVYDARLATELKRLVSRDAPGDPNDELKGGALIALWPQNLTAEDLFAALVPPKNPGLFGMYKQFLWRDIASEVRGVDVPIALSWIDKRVKQLFPEVDELERVAGAMLDAAIKFYRDPIVCDKLAEILLKRARSYTIPSTTLATLSQSPEARRAVGLLAISKDEISPSRLYSDVDFLRTDDLGFLIAEFRRSQSPESQLKFCVTVRQILKRTEPMEVATLDELVLLTRAEPMFAILIRPLLAEVQLDSSEATLARSHFEARSGTRQAATAPRIVARADIHDVLLNGSEDKRVFDEACRLLAGESPPWHPADGLVPPGWSSLSRDSQERLAKAAERLLTECPAPDSSWVRSGIRSYSVIYGHWAFRLLLREAPDKFNSLRENVWQEWIFSVFGDTFTNLIPNDDEVAIMKTALRRAPAEFLEALGSIIQGRIEQPGSICILDRLAAVWDRDIADLLRGVLCDQRLPLQSFDPILGCLLDQKDDEATAMSLDWLRTAPYSEGGELARAVTAAIQLLRCKPEVATDLAWEAIAASIEFARAFFGALTNSVHGDIIAKFTADASEGQFGNLYIRLATAESVEDFREQRGPWAPSMSQKIFESTVIGNLVSRGTPEACLELRRLAIHRPELGLRLAIPNAEEIMMRNTWRPMLPDEVLDLGRSVESVVPSLGGTLLIGGGRMLDIPVNPEPASIEREVMRPIFPAQNRFSGGTFDFSTTVGRQSALDAYTRLWSCREAALSRTARVDPADLSKWKKNVLPAASDKRVPVLRKLSGPTNRRLLPVPPLSGQNTPTLAATSPTGQY